MDESTTCTLAYCLAVYEKPELMADFLENWSSFYVECGIDIYFYDSSVSDALEQVYRNWPRKEHIYYLRFPNGTRKIFRMYKGLDFSKKYDFVWLASDGLRTPKAGLLQILAHLKPDIDYLIIDRYDVEQLGLRVLTDPDQVFRSCAFITTMYGSTILNTHTVCADFDWDYYESILRDYPEMLHWIHTYFYFNRMQQLQQVRVMHMPNSLPEAVLLRISDKKGSSTWTWSKSFWDACRAWITMLNLLPDSYHSKLEASRNLGDCDLLPNEKMLYQHRRWGIYDLQTYWSARKALRMLSSIPQITFFRVAVTPRAWLVLRHSRHMKKCLKRIDQLSRSCKCLMIYGAGVHGAVYGKYFEKHQIPYEAFCVSRRRPGKETYCDHPVVAFSELGARIGEIGFIIGLSKASTRQVLPALLEKADKSHIFLDPEFTAGIGEELGYRLVTNLF